MDSLGTEKIIFNTKSHFKYRKDDNDVYGYDWGMSASEININYLHYK